MIPKSFWLWTVLICSFFRSMSSESNFISVCLVAIDLQLLFQMNTMNTHVVSYEYNHWVDVTAGGLSPRVSLTQ